MRPLVLFYILVFYVILQFSWWAYLMVQLNVEVYDHKVEMVELKQQYPIEKAKEKDILRKKLNERWTMIAGEGAVFLTLLVVGIGVVRRAFRKESFLAKQQRNFL